MWGRLLILVGLCGVEDTWLPIVINMLEDIPQQCPIMKDLIMDVSIGLVLKGVSLLYLTFWLLIDMYCIDKGSPPQSVGQWQGLLKHLHQKCMSSVGKNGPVGVDKRVFQTMPLLP